MEFKKIKLILSFLFVAFLGSCKKPEETIRYSEEEFKYLADSMYADMLLEIEKKSEKNLEIRRSIELKYLRDSLRGLEDSVELKLPTIDNENYETPVILFDTLDN